MIGAVAALLLTGASLAACGSTAATDGTASPAAVSADISAAPAAVEGGPGSPAGTETYFDEANDFSDGVAWVHPADDAWECIDGQGQTLFKLSDTQIPITDFAGGIAIVEDLAADVQPAWAVYGKTGDVLSPSADGTTSYQLDGSLNGYVVVIRTIDTAEGYEDQTGLLDSSGSWFVEPTAALQMSTGYQGAETDGWYSRYGLIEVVPPDGDFRSYKGADYFDTVTGKFVAAPTPKKLTELISDRLFQDGMVFVGYNAVSTNNEPPEVVDLTVAFNAPNIVDKAFYNSDRKLAIDLSEYSDVGPIGGFSEGYCSIMLGNSEHHLFATVIDKTGKQMFEPIPDGDIGAFSQGRALLTEDDDTSCYIDSSGAKVIEGISSGGTFAENGLALVSFAADPSRYCFITVDGKVAF